MRLRNKKTGEIPDKIETITYIQWSGRIMMVYINSDGERIMEYYDSLDDFNEEWEDYKEREWSWYIDWDGEIKQCDKRVDALLKFETKEEAEKAVEELKAWQRLKDEGLTFCGWKITDDGCSVDVETTLDAEIVRAKQKYITDDLNLLFGGEE